MNSETVAAPGAPFNYAAHLLVGMSWINPQID